jgi:hypothetical protein
MMVLPVMAAVTEHIGFGVTASLTYEPPYLFARRMSTLDHLTSGRVGWNIVTGYLDSAARGMGVGGPADHEVNPNPQQFCGSREPGEVPSGLDNGLIWTRCRGCPP